MLLKSALFSLLAAGTMLMTAGLQDKPRSQPEPPAQPMVSRGGQAAGYGPATAITTWADDTTPERFPGSAIAIPQPPGALTTYFNLANRFGKADKEIREAAKAMRQADSRDDKDAAEEKLRELLGADYDSRLNDYTSYLDELEKSLAEMRAKLEKRRGAKEDMIDLRIKVLVAEEDDLGWPTRMPRNRLPGLAPLGR